LKNTQIGLTFEIEPTLPGIYFVRSLTSALCAPLPEINHAFLPSGRLDGMPTRRGYFSGVAATLSITTR